MPKFCRFPAKGLRRFSWAEVRSHRTPGDHWIVLRDKVYDVSTLRHPGGDVIYTHAGEDATDVFGAVHPASAFAMLDGYLIGRVAGDRSRRDALIEADFRAMRAQLTREGVFRASAAYYLLQLATTVALWCVSAWLLDVEGPAAFLCSALLLALFWQQSGWLAHDVLHHQVFANRRVGEVVGVFVGNLFQGYSAAWWKDKHNTHHAVTNVARGARGGGGDPDIDTVPLLAWSVGLGRGAARDASAVGRLLLRYQAVTYLPMLAIARLSWLAQSVRHALGDIPYADVEISTILAHYAVYVWMLSHYSLLGALGYVAVSQCACGLMLASVFGIGHNGMAVVDDWANRPATFVEQQVLATRNIAHGAFTDWFTGGLSYQIEHHLFPTCPRHGLPRVAERTRALCAKHGIAYTCTGFVEGTVDVLAHLARVTDALRAEFPAL